MALMIDAVVLIHSLGVETGRIDEHSRYWESARTSHDLLHHAEAVTMSAIKLVRGHARHGRPSA